MAAQWNGSLVFINDVATQRNCRVNLEVHMAVYSAPIQPNAKLIGHCFTV